MMRRIADTLGVAYVVKGGLQKIGSRLRVQVLPSMLATSTVWSDTYNRELGDVFSVEDDIAQRRS
jgi:TolB-like protein